jgi:cytochrome c-type biogenesis protein CcmH/NrfG
MEFKMPGRKCPVCNFQASENAKFCPDCGAPLTKKAQKNAAKTKSSSNRDMFIIVGVLVVVVVGYLALKSPTKPPVPVQQQQSTATNDEHDHEHENIEGMEDMLANMPVDFNSLVRLGNQTMDAGNFAMAAECYKRALMIDGNSPDVRTDYGACLHGMGLPDRALEEFHNVLANYPNHEVARFNMGIVFYTMDVADSAKYYWESYLDKFPNGSLAGSAKEYLQKLGN